MEHRFAVRLIPHQGAVVVDLEGVEPEGLIDLADAARRARRGDDQLHAVLRQTRQRRGGLVRHLLGVVEQRPVEIDGDEIDRRHVHDVIDSTGGWDFL